MAQPVDSRFTFGRFKAQSALKKSQIEYAKKMHLDEAATAPIVGTPVCEQELPKAPPGRVVKEDKKGRK